MMNSARRLLLAVAVVFVSYSVGFAQGSNQSLSGVVVDSGGGVIPGATVVAKNIATAQTFEVFSNESGVFAIPGIAVGTYSVTITLSGFKTAVLSDVRIVTGTPASIKAVLEIGALNETVEVSSRAELVQTQTAAVSSTLIAEQLNEVPLSSRNALYAVNMLPGVQYGSGGRPARSRHQRPAEQHHQHHRRRCPDRQHAAVDRRFLLDGDAAVGCDRGNHDHRCGPRRRLRPWFRPDSVRDALGHQSPGWQRVPLLASARVQLELLLQQGQQAREE